MTAAPEQHAVTPGSERPGSETPRSEKPGSENVEHVPHADHLWAEARQLAFDSATPIPAAPVALKDALGRVLALDVHALQDLPHYASSAMDGWAVNSSGPWILAEPGHRLAPHQASPIVTGGLIPPGAKAVLRSESGALTTDEDGLPVLALGGNAKPGEPRNGQHIRIAGEEAKEGELLIKSGVLLNPAHLALAALAGRDELEVLGKPLVKLLLTGSEVVSEGVPAPGSVRDTFGPQLGAVVELLGGIRGEQIKVGDSYEEWLTALEEGELSPETPPADVVITTGGTGRSGTDHFRRAIAELGGRLLIDGIAMRPGHPAVLAELPDGRFVLGLPGNPLAAMMVLFTIGTPLLAGLGHGKLPAVGEVPCGAMLDADPGRTRLLPFRFVYGLASPTQHAGPGMMRGLASADGVMVVPPHGVQMGEAVPAFPLPWGPPLPRPKPTQDKAKKPPAKPARKVSSEPVDWSALTG
ncbi:molybdopterin molybdotransferase MoeA [Arthrobacter sp. NA-172]|uniref:molybdopterin molybdotransferase MoeA n=1 Tax=Arthrobacter sp. NA-172 TaxID=3367524 RepID=UPI003754F44E